MNVYQFGIFWTWGLYAALFVWILGNVLFACARAYVFEKEIGKPTMFLPYDSGSHFNDDPGAIVFPLIGYVLLGVVSGFAWPVFWLAAFVWGALYSARVFVRFQKSYQAHKHDKESGAVV